VDLKSRHTEENDEGGLGPMPESLMLYHLAIEVFSRFLEGQPEEIFRFENLPAQEYQE
jgi:hypothetical protein